MTRFLSVCQTGRKVTGPKFRLDKKSLDQNNLMAIAACNSRVKLIGYVGNMQWHVCSLQCPVAFLNIGRRQTQRLCGPRSV